MSDPLGDSDGSLGVLDVGPEFLDLLSHLELGVSDNKLLLLELLLFAVQAESFLFDFLCLSNLFELALLLLLPGSHLLLLTLNPGFALFLLPLLGVLSEFVSQLISFLGLRLDLSVDVALLLLQFLKGRLDLSLSILKVLLLPLQVLEVLLLSFSLVTPLGIGHASVLGVSFLEVFLLGPGWILIVEVVHSFHFLSNVNIQFAIVDVLE